MLHPLQLADKLFRCGGAMGLVLWIDVVAERAPALVEDDGDGIGIGIVGRNYIAIFGRQPTVRK